MSQDEDKARAELGRFLDELDAMLGPAEDMPADSRVPRTGQAKAYGRSRSFGEPEFPGNFYLGSGRRDTGGRRRKGEPHPPAPSPSRGEGEIGRMAGTTAMETEGVDAGPGGPADGGDEREVGRVAAGREVVVRDQNRALVVTGERRVAPRRRWGSAARKAAQREVGDPTGSGRAGWQRSLRAVREAFPYSQDELADRARMSRSTISALELGLRRAHPATRRAIARVLGVEVGEIAW